MRSFPQTRCIQDAHTELQFNTYKQNNTCKIQEHPSAVHDTGLEAQVAAAVPQACNARQAHSSTLVESVNAVRLVRKAQGEGQSVADPTSDSFHHLKACTHRIHACLTSNSSPSEVTRSDLLLQEMTTCQNAPKARLARI